MNTSSDPAWAAITYLIIMGVVLWWAYAGGLILGVVAVLRTKGRVRETAWWSLRAQIAPLAAFVLLFVIWAMQMALNRELIAEGVAIALVLVAMAVGPLMTLWLIGTMLFVGRGVTRAGAR